MLERRALLSGAPSQFIDPHPQVGNQFGATVTVLTNGNVVITSPNDDAGGGSTDGGTGTGAVYFFNGQTGSLISTLTGSHAGDQLASGGITALTNGNFIIDSPFWNQKLGAVTWGSQTTGVTGIVSTNNSLIGSTPSDSVFSDTITALSNGNYVVSSADWNNGSILNVGAVTWGNGATGVTGTISLANSLIGTATGDRVGYEVIPLTNGNYVVDSPFFNSGPIINVGAVTWCSGTTGMTGIVSAANSLMGSTDGDAVGLDGIKALTNGNYVVDSSRWNGNRGAVTWGSGASGVTGQISAANSLVGSTEPDEVGQGGIKALTNGNYVVDSYGWNRNCGAVTWGSGTSGVTGVISAANSLVGSTEADEVGQGGITALTNGNYVVDSYGWNGSRGAVTWGSGTSGVTGAVSAANSLVGTTSGDYVGLDYSGDGVIVLSNGNYLIYSPTWNGSRGAVTWGSGTLGVTGTVSSANSLVGSTADDRLGYGGITPLSNGNYIVDSYGWDGGRGAVTWGSGVTGVSGVISAANSLVGSTASNTAGNRSDSVGIGGVTALSNGNYVVKSYAWNGNRGAVTWGSGASGVTGTVSAVNSLVGTTPGDSVGYGSVTPLSNGNYVVTSPSWDNGSILNAGAVTWGNGATGVMGTISVADSLVGTTTNDQVGDYGITALSNGNYVVSSAVWNNGSILNVGAVTWGNGAMGVTGAISLANSLVGTATGDQVGFGGVTALSNGNYVVGSPYWYADQGAATFGNGMTGVVGDVSDLNSLVGQATQPHPNPKISVTPDIAHGVVYVSFSGNNSGQVYRGSAVTGFSTSTKRGPLIAVSDNLSAVVNGTGIINFGLATLGTPITRVFTVANNGNAPLVVQPATVSGGFSIVENFTRNQTIAVGANASFKVQFNATAMSNASGVVTINSNVATANPFDFKVTGAATKTPPSQFIDPHPMAGNQFGATVTVLANGNVVITSPNDDAGGGITSTGTGAGAVYLFNYQTGALISTLTGSHPGDIMESSVTALSNGNYVLESSKWNGNRGAVTWGSGTKGVTGIISSANSLVGLTALDYVGSSVTALSNGNYVVDSYHWGAGLGAVTWGNGTTGVVGTISAANSLVGTTSYTSSDGVIPLSNGNYVVNSDNWNGGCGAVTWGSGTLGVTGTVGAANSLVGTFATDQVGIGGVTALSNGNYVVNSYVWRNCGAVTWGSGTKGVAGAVSEANSLVGSTRSDFVGVYGIKPLSNGNYVVNSYDWNGHRGAVTWGSGTTGVTGTVSAANSLVGSMPNDRVGRNGITKLSNGNYVVESSEWNGNRGAVTWGSGATGVTGAVSSDNSLVGSTAGDLVGALSVTVLRTGNYVVDSNDWNGDRGAVTWGSGTTGVMGTISAANSLIGTTGNDHVGIGGIAPLSNGNYVVDSFFWNGNCGAVTWGSETTGVTGTISAVNSLVGSMQNDQVGIGGIAPLSNGNYVVDSPAWNGNRGAVTWGSGTSGVMGTVSAANSLVGTTIDDAVGSRLTVLGNGNYVVTSINWNNASMLDVGAVTWCSGTTGLIGVISAANSLVGTNTGDQVGYGGVAALSNSNYVVDSYKWNGSRGAATWGSGTTGVTGTISDANSLVGTATGDQVGYEGVTALTNGNYVVTSPNWNKGSVLNVGAVTWGKGVAGVTGRISAANSLIGTTVNDHVGINGITPLRNGSYVVVSANWSNGAVANAGAVTFGNGITGVSGAVDEFNSLVGQMAKPSNFAASLTIIEDDKHDVFYAVTPNEETVGYSTPFTGLGLVFRGSIGAGFTNITTAGPSVRVSDYSNIVSGGSGTVNFGLASLGTPLTQTITVTNNGNAVLTVQPVTVTGAFTILSNFTVNESIAPQASASFALRLNATALGPQNGVVTFDTNIATAKSFKFNIMGTVTASKIEVQQGGDTLVNGTGTVGLGDTLVGAPTTRVITVTNHGNAALVVTSVAAPAGFSVLNDLVTNQLIAAGASATFTLQLDAGAAGAPSGIVTIGSNDPSNRFFTFHVGGMITAPLIEVQQDSTPLASGNSTVNVGNTPVGTPAMLIVTVTNQGNAPLIVQPVTVPTGFSIVVGTNFTANQSIPAGASDSFTLQLDAVATGNPSGTVTITNSDTTASPFTFNITGIVVSRVTAVPVLVVTQGSISLGNDSGSVIFNQVSVGAPVSQVFTVANHGNSPLVVQPVTAPSGFSVLNNFTVDQFIATGTSASFTIQLNGNATDSPTGAVTIASNDPAASTFRFDVVANHRPTAITLSNSVVSSDLTSAVVAGAFTTTDADSRAVSRTPESFHYSVASPTFLNGSVAVPIFSIDDQGDLVVAAGAPVGVYSNVPITTTDRGGLSITPNFTIYVTGASTIGVPSSVNVASGTPIDVIVASFPDPVIEVQNAAGSTNAGGSGNQLLRAALAAAQASNPNADTLTIKVISYQLGVGGDNSDFTIDASGHLRTAITLNAAVKTSYHITIISTNVITGLSTIHPYTVTIVPVLKNTIVVKLATFNLPEATANGTTVGSVAATDSGAQALTYAITDGNTNGAFAINSATGRITVANSAALDLATNSNFVLTVRASDNGASSSAKITIHLTGITLSNSSIAENAPIGATIGVFKTTAATARNAFHYSLVAGKVNNAYFTLDATGHLKLNASLNATVKNSYIIEVLSTDQHGVTISKRFTIAILGPSNLTLSNSSVARTAPVGTIVGQFKTTDAGTGNTFRYSLVPGKYNDAAFTVDADGNLKLNLRLTSTLRKSLTVNVVSTDQRGLSISRLFTITITRP